jgi:4-amino-4-deoxy-L-arabinose transferase-like glycosyltransferase
VKWSKFTPHEKSTRIKMAIFFVGLTVILVYTMGIDDFTSLLGSLTLLGGVIYLFGEIKSWFTK